MKKYSILFTTYLILLSIFYTIATDYTVNKNTIALIFDLDDTISTNYRIDVGDFVREIKQLTPDFQTKEGQKHLTALEALGREIVNKKSDATAAEIMSAMIAYLKKQGYNENCYKQPLMELAIQPVAIDSMIELLYQLKREGYILIGATNQNYHDHIIYRTKLKAKNLDLTKIFDFIVTTYNPNYTGSTKLTLDNYQCMDNQTIMVNSGIRKPFPSYFSIIQKLGKEHGAKNFVLIDDLYKNVLGALWAGIRSIQFHLPLYRPGIPAREFLDKLDHSTEQLKNKLQSKIIF